MEFEETAIPADPGLPSRCEYRLSNGLIYNIFTGALRIGTKRGAELSHREIQCLLILDGPDASRGIPRKTFLLKVWGSKDHQTKALDVHFFKIRRKLRPLGFELQFKSNRFFLMKSEMQLVPKPALENFASTEPAPSR